MMQSLNNFLKDRLISPLKGYGSVSPTKQKVTPEKSTIKLFNTSTDVPKPLEQSTEETTVSSQACFLQSDCWSQSNPDSGCYDLDLKNYHVPDDEEVLKWRKSSLDVLNKKNVLEQDSSSDGLHHRGPQTCRSNSPHSKCIIPAQSQQTSTMNPIELLLSPIKAWMTQPKTQKTSRFASTRNISQSSPLSPIIHHSSTPSKQKQVLAGIWDKEKEKYEQSFLDRVQMMNDICEVKQRQNSGTEYTCASLYYTGEVNFLEKAIQIRDYSQQEWEKMIEDDTIFTLPRRNIHYSILKGHWTSIRKEMWDYLTNVKQVKRDISQPYSQLRCPSGIPLSDLSIIDKDYTRTFKDESISLREPLRSILIAFCRVTQCQYFQGMNVIAGVILSILKQKSPRSETFEEDAFWIFLGLMKQRNWIEIYEPQFVKLKEFLKELDLLVRRFVPQVSELMDAQEWDFSIFIQCYLTILLYNTPLHLAEIVLDLFLFEGVDVIHNLIVHMLYLNKRAVQQIKDESKLMEYFKKNIFEHISTAIDKDRETAEELDDFQINILLNCRISQPQT